MMAIPNCEFLVEGNGCGHPDQKKFLWIFNRICVICTNKGECSLQRPHPKPNYAVVSQITTGVDMSDIMEELKKDPPKS